MSINRRTPLAIIAMIILSLLLIVGNGNSIYATGVFEGAKSWKNLDENQIVSNGDVAPYEINDYEGYATEKSGVMYSFTVSGDGLYKFKLACQEGVEDIDPYMYLFDSEGDFLSYDDDGGRELNSQLIFYLNSGSTYYIFATTFGDFGEDVSMQLSSEYIDETATISGTVKDSNDAAVSGIKVTVYKEMEGLEEDEEDGEPYSYYYYDKYMDHYTDENGGYTAYVEPGNYKVGFSDPDGIYVSQYYYEKGNLKKATIIEATADNSVSNIDAVLEQGGLISGTVTDQDGEPLSNIYVEVFMDNPNYNDEEDDDKYLDVAYSYTEADGTYQIGGLATGDYYIGFHDDNEEYIYQYYSGADGGTTNRAEAENVAVEAGETISEINAKMQLGGSISGKVTDEDGNPIEDVHVSVYKEYGEWGWECSDYIPGTITDEEGNYTIRGLAAGDYRLSFSHDEYIDAFYADSTDVDSAEDIHVTVGEEYTGINMTLKMGLSISGTVTDSNDASIPYMNVNVYDEEQEWYKDVLTDENGDYVINGLSPGTYYVGFRDYNDVYMAEYYNDVANINDATPIIITDESRYGIDAQLSEGAYISGTVTDEDGEALEGVEVVVRTTDWSSYHSSYSDGSGKYKITGLTDGNYIVQFIDSNGDYINVYYTSNDGVYESAEAESISIESNQSIDNVDIKMIKGSTVSGKVIGENDEPLEDIKVCAWGVTQSLNINSVTTDSSGEYTIKGIPTGVAINISYYDYIGDYISRNYDDTDANPIQLSDLVENNNVDTIKMEKGYHISGSITKEGNPWYGSGRVYCYEYNEDNGDWSFVNNCYLDDEEDNGYSIKGLSPGTYRLEFKPYTDYIPIQHWEKAGSIDYASDIVITDQDREGVDFELVDQNAINGVVTNESDEPIEGIKVIAELGDDDTFTEEKSTYTDSDGHYFIEGLGAGGYRIKFVDDKNGLYNEEYWVNDPEEDDYSLIVFDEGYWQIRDGVNTSLSELESDLTGNISGTVNDLKENAVVGLTVSALKNNDSVWEEEASVATDIDGSYVFSSLPVGYYKLKFYDGENNYRTQYWNGKSALEDADSIYLSADESITDKNVTMIFSGFATVSFNSDGGSSVSDMSITPGSVIGELPVPPTKPGFTFNGWFNDGNELTVDSVIIEDTTYIAKWTAIPPTKYMVTFDSAGGSAVSSVEVVSGEAIGALPAAPTKSGYIFDGWFNGEDELTETTIITSDITYAAKWTLIPPTRYTVTFDSVGGSAVSSVEVVSGQAIGTLPEPPTKTGYTFDGWFNDGVQLTTGSVITSDITYTAKWTPIPPVTYTVRFNSNGGTAVSSKTVNKGSTIGTLPTSSQKGYTFGGWYTGSTKVSSSTVINNDITLTAKWLSDDTTLKKIKLSTGKLTKKFKKTKYSYSAKINKKKSSVKITPTKTNSKAKIQMKVGSGKYKTVKYLKVKLKKGKSKTVYMKVISESGKSKVYKVKVKRSK